MTLRVTGHLETDDGRAACTGEPAVAEVWAGDVVIEQCQACAALARQMGPGSTPPQKTGPRTGVKSPGSLSA